MQVSADSKIIRQLICLFSTISQSQNKYIFFFGRSMFPFCYIVMVLLAVSKDLVEKF